MQRNEIQSVLDGINPLNAGKKKEIALELMKKYYDGLRSFDSQLKQVERGNKDLQATVSSMQHRENDLERKLYREQQRHTETVNEMISLRSDYDDCMAFIQSIPKDLRKQLVEQYEYLRNIEQQILDERMEFEI
jgi:peptidoglycan hydrolase CwlO-like protein